MLIYNFVEEVEADVVGSEEDEVTCIGIVDGVFKTFLFILYSTKEY